MNSKDTYDLIEAYLQGELDSNEKLHFEKELESNSELKQQLQIHQLSNDILIEQRIQNVKGIMYDKRVSTGKSSFKLLGWGALLFLLVVGVIYYMNIPSETILDATTERTQTHNITNLTQNRSNTQNNIELETAPQIEESGNNVVKEYSTSIPKSVKIAQKEIDVSTFNDSIQTKTILSKDAKIIENKTNSNTTVSPENTKEDTQPFVKPSTTSDTQLSVSPSDQENAKGETDEPLQEISSLDKKRVNLEISPQYDDYDKFPFKDHESGSLQIFSRQGRLIRELSIKDGEPAYWDGKDKNGNISAGYYIYTFKSSTLILTGGITVIY